MDGGRRRTLTMRPDGFSWEDGGEGLLLEKSELVPSSLAPSCASPLVFCRSSGGRQSGGRIRGGVGRIHRSSGRWPRAGARRARPGSFGHGGHDISILPGLDIFVTMADGYNAGNTKDGEPRAIWMADGIQWAGTWVEPAEDHRKGDHAGMVLNG